MLTFFNQFPQRISDGTTQRTTQGIPLTSPAVPAPAPDPDDPWASSRSAPPVDRTTPTAPPSAPRYSPPTR